MAFMASQVIAYRLSEFTLTTDWILLTDACVNCLRSDFSTMSEADLREQLRELKSALRGARARQKAAQVRYECELERRSLSRD